MRLSFLPDGSPDCPLLLLSHFTSEDVAVLRRVARDLANGDRRRAGIEECMGAQAEPQLQFSVDERDRGILCTPPKFECLLTRATWWQVEGLIEPCLSQSATGYQWLDQSGEVALLLSRDGTW